MCGATPSSGGHGRLAPNHCLNGYHMSMKELLFLDSRDLIDCIEHHTPCGLPRLYRSLSRRNGVLVLTFTNVVESTPRSSDQNYASHFLARLEALPHVFASHTEVLR